MATSELKINGKTKVLQLLGSIGLTDTEMAEISAELDALLSETDEEWLATLAGYDIAAKIRFAQLCRGTILNAISKKGVTVPDVQPLRTIFELIEQIETGGSVLSVSTKISSRYSNHKVAISTAPVAKATATLD